MTQSDAETRYLESITGRFRTRASLGDYPRSTCQTKADMIAPLIRSVLLVL